MQALREVEAKLVSARFGNPLNGIDLILVAGPYGKSTVMLLLEGILKEAGRSVTSVSATDGIDKSMTSFYRAMSTIKKRRSQIVLVETTDDLLKSGALHGVRINTVLAVGECEVAKELLALSPKHVVTPTELAAPDGTVEPYQQINFGMTDDAEAKIDSVKLYRHGSELKMTIDHQTKLEVASYLTGYANVSCIAAAIAAAYVLGVNLDAVQEGIADIDTQDSRFEVLTHDAPYSVILDAAQTNESVALAIESAKALTKRRLLVVFDSMPDETVISDAMLLVDRMFVVGDEQSARADIDMAASAKGAVEKASRSAKKDDCVLLIGTTFSRNDIAHEGVTSL